MPPCGVFCLREQTMKARHKLKPGEKGTRKLTAQYGDALICVRYRYDEVQRKCIKTVEQIVDEIDWTPPPPRFAADMLVPVRIAHDQIPLRDKAKAAGGRWNPTQKLWFIPYGNIKGTVLEKHIILDAKDKRQKP